MTDPEYKPLFLTELPMPPSSNAQYKVAQVKGVARFTASQELTQYKHMMKGYYYQHLLRIKVSEKEIHRWLLKGAMLNVRLHCYFERKRIYCKDGKPKRLDISNRLKSVHDCLADMFKVDDCYFFEVSAIKHVCPADSGEYANIEISPHF